VQSVADSYTEGNGTTRSPVISHLFTIIFFWYEVNSQNTRRRSMVVMRMDKRVFGNRICGGLFRLALLHVCIYTSAPARLTVHPHLLLPLHAFVHPLRDCGALLQSRNRRGIYVDFALTRFDQYHCMDCRPRLPWLGRQKQQTANVIKCTLVWDQQRSLAEAIFDG